MLTDITDITFSLGVIISKNTDPNLVIRDEYMEINAAVHARSTLSVSGEEGVVITGQPGIGTIHPLYSLTLVVDYLLKVKLCSSCTCSCIVWSSKCLRPFKSTIHIITSLTDLEPISSMSQKHHPKSVFVPVWHSRIAGLWRPIRVHPSSSMPDSLFKPGRRHLIRAKLGRGAKRAKSSWNFPQISSWQSLCELHECCFHPTIHGIPQAGTGNSFRVRNPTYAKVGANH